MGWFQGQWSWSTREIALRVIGETTGSWEALHRSTLERSYVGLQALKGPFYSIQRPPALEDHCNQEGQTSKEYAVKVGLWKGGGVAVDGAGCVSIKASLRLSGVVELPHW